MRTSIESRANELSAARSDKHIAIIANATKLADFEPGLDRTTYIAKMLSDAGYRVDLITSSFQHWQKAHRDIYRSEYSSLGYNVVFLDEPGYSKNIDPARIWSHHRLARNLWHYLKDQHGYWDAIWALVPPNDLAATAARFARREGIPFIADVSDLWPEAMRMVLDVPILSDIAFLPMSRDAKKVFRGAWGAVGTSREYASHPDKYRKFPLARKEVVPVGGDLEEFDEGARANPVEKPEDEIWLCYAGTLGTSYDLFTLIDAVSLASGEMLDEGEARVLKLKVLGDGPLRDELRAYAERKAPGAVDFLGYMEHGKMAGYLVASDILINSLVEGAPHSIVSKVSDYLAAGRAMVNTGTSPEMVELVDDGGCGLSVAPGNASALKDVILELARDNDRREAMGHAARRLFEERFDRKVAYFPIIDLVDSAVGVREPASEREEEGKKNRLEPTTTPSPATRAQGVFGEMRHSTGAERDAFAAVRRSLGTPTGISLSD